MGHGRLVLVSTCQPSAFPYGDRPEEGVRCSCTVEVSASRRGICLFPLEQDSSIRSTQSSTMYLLEFPNGSSRHIGSLQLLLARQVNLLMQVNN